MSETKQPSIENNSQSAQNKASEADKKEGALLKLFPLQDTVGDIQKLLGLFEVKKTSKIDERHEGSGFTELSFKGGFSTGSFWLENIRTMIPNLLGDLEEPRKKKIRDEIYGQAWVEKCQKGDSHFIYHGGSGQEKNFGIQLTPKEFQSRIAICYKMGTLETTFTLGLPFMIVTKTRDSILRKTETQEIVYLPAKYGIKQQEELNKMKIVFISSTIQGLMIESLNKKRSLEGRDDDDDNHDEDACNKGDPYKQLKS